MLGGGVNSFCVGLGIMPLALPNIALIRPVLPGNDADHSGAGRTGAEDNPEDHGIPLAKECDCVHVGLLPVPAKLAAQIRRDYVDEAGLLHKFWLLGEELAGKRCTDIPPGSAVFALIYSATNLL